MQIYFAASIRGGRENQKNYAEIIRFLQQNATVLTEHIGSAQLSQTGEAGLSDLEIFDRDIRMLAQADAVIAEVSTPSLGVGYELGHAEALGKPVLCLFNQKSGKLLSAMISGNHYFKVLNYSQIDEISSPINSFLQQVLSKKNLLR